MLGDEGWIGQEFDRSEFERRFGKEKMGMSVELNGHFFARPRFD